MSNKDNKPKTKVLWESKGKTPDGNPFSAIKEARNYYTYLERGGVDSIAFILYNGNDKTFGCINESKPPRDEIEGEEVQMTTAFGGSIDSNKRYSEICKIEVLEESGYDVPKENIHFVGKVLVSTQMSQMCSLYLVDVTNIEKTAKAEHEGDDNEFSKNSVEWMNIDEASELKDWKTSYIIFQSIIQDVISK